MYGKKQWKGREVEGRYSDMMTYFVRELNDQGKLDLDEVMTDSGGYQNYEKYPHYYFTIEYMLNVCGGNGHDEAKARRERHVSIIRSILDNTNCVVTVEANGYMIDMEALPIDLFNRCHIIYRIKDSCLARLKETDTLSIDAGWYRVHQITKLNMMEMTPDNYKFDET